MVGLFPQHNLNSYRILNSFVISIVHIPPTGKKYLSFFNTLYCRQLYFSFCEMYWHHDACWKFTVCVQIHLFNQKYGGFHPWWIRILFLTLTFLKDISSVSLQQTEFALRDVYSSSHRRFIGDYNFIFVFSWHHEKCWQCTKFMSLRLDVLFNLNYGVSSSVLIGHYILLIVKQVCWQYCYNICISGKVMNKNQD